MPLVAAVGVRLLGIRVRLKQILTVLPPQARLVGMGIHHIASHSQYLPVAHVEVYSEVLRIADALVAAKPAEAVSIAIGKSKVVGIVSRTDERQLVSIPESVDIKRCLITVVGAISRLGRAKPAILHPFLHRKVDDGLIFTIVNAGHSCQVALSLYYLQLVNHVHRQIFRRHLRVVGEKFLPIHQYLGHLFAIGRYLAVGVNLHTRQSLQQILHHGIGLRLIRIGIKLHRVLHHLDGGLDCRHCSLGKHVRRLRQFDIAGIHILVAHSHVLVALDIAYITRLKYILATLHFLKRKTSVKIGRRALNVGAVGTREQSDSRLCQRLARIVRYRAAYRVSHRAYHTAYRHYCSTHRYS